MLCAFLYILVTFSWALGQEPAGDKHSVNSQGKPFFFLPEKNGVKLSNQFIDYRLSNQSVLQLGPLEVDGKALKMQMSLEYGEYREVEFGGAIITKGGPLYALSFDWPLEALSAGLLEILDDNNNSIWRQKVSEQSVARWVKFTDQERFRVEPTRFKKQGKKKNTFKGQYLNKPLSSSHWHSNFGVFGKDFFHMPVWRIKKSFRFCLSNDDGSGRLVICSPKYKIVRESGQYRLRKIDRRYQSEVLVNDKPATQRGTAIFVDNQTAVKMAVLFATGGYYEYISYPRPVNIVDIVWDKERNLVQVTGFGEPTFESHVEVKRDTPQIFGFLNFKPTIGDLRTYWKPVMREDTPYLYFKGYGGAIFRQGFDFKELPQEKHRLVIDENSRVSTYSEVASVYGKQGSGLKVFSKQLSTEATDGQGGFEWNFFAPEKGKYNKSLISTKDGEYIASSFYEVFRGYPLELSARLTGVVSNSFQLVLMAEVAGQYWFDNLLGLDSYYLDRLRWGVAVKHFTAFAGIGAKEEGQDVIQLAATNGDLKYRLTPGVWGRDPALGLLASF